MSRMLVFLVLIVPTWSLADPTITEATETPAADEFFEREIRPLLVERCWVCHGGKVPSSPRGGLSLTSRAGLLHGGESGPAAVEGKPEDSLIIHAVRYIEEPRMPPKKRLSEPEIQNLTRWVEMGLPWPETTGEPASLQQPATDRPEFKLTDVHKAFWSFRPIVDHRAPPVKNVVWPISPIDRFVLARLEEKGLAPGLDADRRTLIRRATFDLTGLPPTPEDIDAFLADPAPTAFEGVIDRLLASPQYGERWGRHWLDLAHYADTAGETADFPVPEAYRYRDYVIDAFNGDKPYDEFVREQVAGDLLAPGGPSDRVAERIIATGFLATSRRFGFDPESYHHLTIEDTIDTLGRSVLGLSVACARCHDHKFDPIPTADYYALYGIFASTRYPFPGSEEKKQSRDLVPLPGAGGDLAYAMAESSPMNARIQRRGDPKNLGSEVPRHFLQILGGLDRPAVTSGSGRLALAGWLTDPANPLTARVMVNRIWQHHFGKGIVATPSDFGKRGRPPSHPELLDDLATRFMEGGWSIKAMHKRIMLSHVYQLSSDPVNTEVDPENLWLSRFDRRRLEAESIRDAILAVGGGLDRTRGAPHPFPPRASWGFTQHNPFEAVYETNRRSVYLMIQRNRRHPFLALFDGADPNSSTDQRRVTTVPTQALFFMNNPFVHEQSIKFAGRLLRVEGDDNHRADLAHQLALGRPATPDEARSAASYVRQCADLQPTDLPAEQRTRAAWASYARILFGTNEFIYLD